MLFSSLTLNVNTFEINPKAEPIIAQNTVSNSYTLHDPILIQDESDFVEQGFTGSGTGYDPYILQGVRIENSTSCVQIRSVDSIFVLKDCEFFSNSTKADRVMNVILTDTFLPKIENCSFINGGLSLYYSVGGNISDSTITNSYFGITFGSSNNVKIFRCLIENCSYAISSYRGDNALIKWNTIINCNSGISAPSGTNIFGNNLLNISGVALKVRTSSHVLNNNISNCAFGMYFSTIVSDISATGNRISDCIVGIYTYFASYCEISNNTLARCVRAGIDFERSRSMT
ncbi:MAG: right-handed parallel beta-helix repeat-containing protein, partial [Candidatus Thorarchaeota archaeon]|nr:right-handed parallel beta-helix repeat-containing protein [Candidatus Thorarchaeota archaeon]